MRLAKERSTRRIDDVFSCCVLARAHQDALAFTLEKICGQTQSQTTSASDLSDRITMRLGDLLHFFLALSTCDPIAQDAF